MGHFRVHFSLVFKVRLILEVELITITKLSHVDLLLKRDREELGNGARVFACAVAHELGTPDC